MKCLFNDIPGSYGLQNVSAPFQNPELGQMWQIMVLQRLT